MKHIPERSCCACGAKKPQKELRRIAAQNGGQPILDEDGKAAGRGAYLCFDANCVELAWKRKSLERALKLSDPLSEEFKTKLRSVA